MMIVMAIAGCERPGDRSPPGFVEACYGGRAEMPRNWVCSNNRLVLTVEGGESDWPALARIVSEFGRNRELKVFDTGASVPNYIRTLEVSVCSSDGLFLLMDKRIYADPAKNSDGNRITAVFRTYKNAFDWKPLAQEFVDTLQKNWRGPVKVEWPPAIPDNEKKGLPDRIESCVEKAN